MVSRNTHARLVLPSILGLVLAFQLCAAPAARGQYFYCDGGSTYDFSQVDYHSIWVDGEGTVLDFTATIQGGVYMCWLSPGATLNFGTDARASVIDAYIGSHVNLYGGSVDWAVLVYPGAQVTVYGDQFRVYRDQSDLVGTAYSPGTILSDSGTVTVAASDVWGSPLFTGPVSLSEGATVLLGIEAEDPYLDVAIDVKPGSSPSIICVQSYGQVPVAVLSTETFDATQVPPETVEFAGAGVATCESGNHTYMAHAKDVDGDGYDDMVFHFRTRDLQLEDGVKKAALTLTGQVMIQDNSTLISGTEDVYILWPMRKLALPMKNGKLGHGKYDIRASHKRLKRGEKRTNRD